MLDKIAFLFSSIFFGDCFYISIVEHPARMVCPIPAALKQWRNSYPIAAKLQVFLLLVGSILATISYFSNGQTMWLMAALFLFINLPYTVIFLLPTNEMLYKTDEEKTVKQLLERWGQRHFLRTCLSFVSTIIILWIL